MRVRSRIAGLERRMRVTGCPGCGGRGVGVRFVLTRDDGLGPRPPPAEPPRYGCSSCGRIAGVRFEFAPSTDR